MDKFIDAIQDEFVYVDFDARTGHYNHHVDFIFHDSRIVSDLDSRQMVTMLKVAKEKTSLHDYQYILSLNEANLKKGPTKWEGPPAAIRR